MAQVEVLNRCTERKRAVLVFCFYIQTLKFADCSVPSLLSFHSQLITREHFEDALKELQDEGIIVVMGKNTIRIC